MRVTAWNSPYGRCLVNKRGGGIMINFDAEDTEERMKLFDALWPKNMKFRKGDYAEVAVRSMRVVGARPGRPKPAKLVKQKKA